VIPLFSQISNDQVSIEISIVAAKMSEVIKASFLFISISSLITIIAVSHIHFSWITLFLVIHIQNYLESVDETGGTDVVPQMTLPTINARILQKIAAYCMYYQLDPMREIPKPLKSSSLGDFVQQWYVDLINIDSSELYELIMAANYLDIKPLLALSCSAVAAMIRGKTPDEIRSVLGVTSDFTPVP